MLAKMQEDLRECKKSIERAQARAKLYSDQHRTPRRFEIGGLVFLRLKPNSSLSTGKCTKLSPHYCGPFKILEKINEVAYRLDLPKHVKIHCVFHVSFLKKALSRFENILPSYVDVEGVEQQTHDPIKILDERTRRLRNRDITEYLIEWTNKPIKEATWESVAFARE